MIRVLIVLMLMCICCIKAHSQIENKVSHTLETKDSTAKARERVAEIKVPLTETQELDSESKEINAEIQEPLAKTAEFTPQTQDLDSEARERTDDTLSAATTAEKRQSCEDSIACESGNGQARHLFGIAPTSLSTALFGAGTALTFVNSFTIIDVNIRNHIQKWRHESVMQGMRIRIDDGLQYVPFASVYAFQLMGINGKHNALGYSLRAATTYAAVFAATQTIKYTAKVTRPDSSAHNSFVSGHTATAFAGAEMLRLEYKHRTPWIGFCGYVVATATGLLRMYNNRHWFADVLGGAGIGIISAQFSYYLCDKLFAPRPHTTLAYLQPFLL